jgi:hypothetical protein
MCRRGTSAIKSKGLTVIGVHTPEFTFAQYESNVERGIREFGLTYPIVVDSNRATLEGIREPLLANEIFAR